MTTNPSSPGKDITFGPSHGKHIGFNCESRKERPSLPPPCPGRKGVVTRREVVFLTAFALVTQALLVWGVWR